MSLVEFFSKKKVTKPARFLAIFVLVGGTKKVKVQF